MSALLDLLDLIIILEDFTGEGRKAPGTSGAIRARWAIAGVIALAAVVVVAVAVARPT